MAVHVDESQSNNMLCKGLSYKNISPCNSLSRSDSAFESQSDGSIKSSSSHSVIDSLSSASDDSISSSPGVIVSTSNLSLPLENFRSEESNIFEMKRSAVCSSGAEPAPKIYHKSGSIEKYEHESPLEASKPVDESIGVFLGGSCNPTTWRRDIAIPMLTRMKISFYNPQVSEWSPQLIQKEHEAKKNAKVLFYVLDSKTRSIVVMCEVANALSKKEPLVLVTSGLKGPGSPICNEALSISEYDELIGGQLLLERLVEMHQYPVFNDIETALRATSKLVQENLHPMQLNLAEINFDGHLLVGNKLINIANTFESLDLWGKGELTLTDVETAYRLLTGSELTKDKIPNSLCPPVQRGLMTSRRHKLNKEQFISMLRQLICSNSMLKDIPSDIRSKIATLIEMIQHKSTNTTPEAKDNTSSMLQSNVHETDSLRDVYISSSDHDWLQGATQQLKKHNISFIRDDVIEQVNHSSIGQKVKEALKHCRYVFFHIGNSARSLRHMIMVSYITAFRSNLIVSYDFLPKDCEIMDEKLSEVAIKDYNRGRSYMSEFAARDDQRVFDNSTEALQYLINSCKRPESSFKKNL